MYILQLMMKPSVLVILDQSVLISAVYDMVICYHISFSDVKSLENVLRRAVIEGQPKRLRAWRKIFIMVEGVYRLVDT